MDEESGILQPLLCELCQQFVSDFIAVGLRVSKDTPPGESWTDDIPRSRSEDFWRYGFPHHDSFESLTRSAKLCRLCDLIIQDFPEGPNGDQSLKLFPVQHWGGHGLGSFLVTFANAPYNVPRHIFKFGRRRPYDTDVAADAPASGSCWVERDFERAIPDSTLSQDSFETMRFWLNDCLKTHTKCATKLTTLPTRVIDVGTTSQSTPRLRTSSGEEQYYVALTHCWGGEIPCQTVGANLEEYHRELPIDNLPQNFKDAIQVTRMLGLQYVWIDALCIIQDSDDDWRAEAAKMAAIYRESIVTLSPDFVSQSTDGFLKDRCTKQCVINADFAVRKVPRKFIDSISDCILNTRGWCMQERLLSRALLHFGEDQMYWECRTAASREAGGRASQNSDLTSDRFYRSATISFAELRRVFVGTEGQYGLDKWYQIVEEFSSRRLTYDNDKLPALAGAAQQVRSAGLGGEYIAGHWSHNFTKWLFWLPADVDRTPRIKAAGPIGLAALTRPAVRRVPSWSWASVEGVISFKAPRDIEGSEDSEMKLLSTDITTGFDDLTARRCEGLLKLRGLMAMVVYKGGANAVKKGSVIHHTDDNASLAANEAVLDLTEDRERSRQCWVMMSSKSLRAGLILEEGSDGIFRRIGFASNTYGKSPEDAAKFTLREIELA